MDSNFARLEKSLNKISVKMEAPVHLWNPEYCGDLDIRILRDGSWLYQGSKINRLNLIKLFSSVLKKEGDKFFLVTPVEKIGIMVDDAPFVIDQIQIEGSGTEQEISFMTQVGQIVHLDKDHHLRIEYKENSQQPSPYVNVRNNLDALLDRKTFYKLVDLGSMQKYEGDIWYGVWSNSVFFPLILKCDLENID